MWSATSQPKWDQNQTSLRRRMSGGYILYAKFMPKKNLNSVIWLLQPNMRDRVSLSSLSPKQMFQSSSNGPKLLITLLKVFALTFQRVVQSFAKESFCSKLSSLSISKFSFTAPKSCSLFGENFISFVISTTISSTSFINLFDFVASFTDRFSECPWQCVSIALGWTLFIWAATPDRHKFGLSSQTVVGWNG